MGFVRRSGDSEMKGFSGHGGCEMNGCRIGGFSCFLGFFCRADVEFAQYDFVDNKTIWMKA